MTKSSNTNPYNRRKKEDFFMFVKLFDENHELDLEKKVNAFLSNYDAEDIIDIKYQVATLYDGRSQVYCYSCLIIVDEDKM